MGNMRRKRFGRSIRDALREAERVGALVLAAGANVTVPVEPGAGEAGLMRLTIPSSAEVSALRTDGGSWSWFVVPGRPRGRVYQGMVMDVTLDQIESAYFGGVCRGLEDAGYAGALAAALATVWIGARDFCKHGGTGMAAGCMCAWAPLVRFLAVRGYVPGWEGRGLPLVDSANEFLSDQFRNRWESLVEVSGRVVEFGAKGRGGDDRAGELLERLVRLRDEYRADPGRMGGWRK